MNGFGRVAQIGMLISLASCGGAKLGGGAGGATAGNVGTGQAGAGGTGGGQGGGGGTAGIGGQGGIDGTAGIGATAGASGGGARDGYSPSSCIAMESPAPGGSSGSSGCQPSDVGCGADLCGNGTRDTCDAAFDGCPGATNTERCDGDDLGAETCASLGYGSGQPTCTSSCRISTAGCDLCTTASDILSCGKVPLETSKAGPIGLAVGTSELGLAWIAARNGLSAGSSGVNTISFARLARSGEPIASSIIAQEVTYPCHVPWAQIAVAPGPGGGWIVAVGGDPEVFVIAVDGAGQPVARLVLDRLAPYSFVRSVLVPRADGGPLLLWQAANQSPRAALIAADGLSATAPVDLPVPGTISPIDAASLPNGFVAVVPHTGGGAPPAYHGLTLVRFASDGRIASTADILRDENISVARIAAGSGDLRLFYTTGDPATGGRPDDGLIFRRVSNTGDVLTAAILLGQATDFHIVSRALDLGGDTGVLFTSLHPSLIPSSSYPLILARLTPEGTMRSQRSIAAGPYVMFGAEIVQNGPELIAAWVDPRGSFGDVGVGIEIARVRP